MGFYRRKLFEAASALVTEGDINMQRVDGVAIETVDAPSVEAKPAPTLKGWDDVVNR